MRVTVVGTSTRAIAESAARAGFTVTAVDAFADLDQHPSVDARAVDRGTAGETSARALADVAMQVPADGVAYLSPFENHPDLVAQLAGGRTLLGNAPDVLRQVRDPRRLMQALAQRGFRVPDTRLAGEPMPQGVDGASYLAKPLASGGGRGVRRYRADEQVAEGRLAGEWYRQQYVSGIAASIAFIAAGGRAVPLAVSRQLIGETAFGADGFRYCGTIVSGDIPPSIPSTVAAECRALMTAVAAEFPLVGVNGVDFIVSEDRAVPLEINPRWSASLELIERATGQPLFGAHARACLAGELPAPDVFALPPGGAWGKAVVFAIRDAAMGDPAPWLADPDIRDVPKRHERITAGHPICTVFATGSSDGICFDRLVERAAFIHRAMA